MDARRPVGEGIAAVLDGDVRCRRSKDRSKERRQENGHRGSGGCFLLSEVVRKRRARKSESPLSADMCTVLRFMMRKAKRKERETTTPGGRAFRIPGHLYYFEVIKVTKHL